MERDKDMGRDPFEEGEDVVSATECTGILPALPMDGTIEAQSGAAELYAIHAPRRSERKRRRNEPSAE